jgi:hypothetical protein
MVHASMRFAKMELGCHASWSTIMAASSEPSYGTNEIRQGRDRRLDEFYRWRCILQLSSPLYRVCPWLLLLTTTASSELLAASKDTTYAAGLDR